MRGPPFNGIVIDVGCMTWGSEDSILTLIDRFDPHVLFGFDASEELVPGVELVDGTTVIRIQAAAWFYDGLVRWHSSKTDAGVNDNGDRMVDAVNLGYLIQMLPPGCVLKMDAEGLEYIMLPVLKETRLDTKLHLAWIEWHPEETSNGFFREDRAKLRCPMEVWEP